MNKLLAYEHRAPWSWELYLNSDGYVCSYLEDDEMVVHLHTSSTKEVHDFFSRYGVRDSIVKQASYYIGNA